LSTSATHSPPPSLAHSALHSFPTRRSSDLHHLHGPPQQRLLRQPVIEQLDHAVGLADAPDLLEGRKLLVVFENAEHEGRNDGVEDRKSTRLNSSHVKISYAVFCLKKKNMQI